MSDQAPIREYLPAVAGNPERPQLVRSFGFLSPWNDEAFDQALQRRMNGEARLLSRDRALINQICSLLEGMELLMGRFREMGSLHVSYGDLDNVRESLLEIYEELSELIDSAQNGEDETDPDSGNDADDEKATLPDSSVEEA